MTKITENNLLDICTFSEEQKKVFGKKILEIKQGNDTIWLCKIINAKSKIKIELKIKNKAILFTLKKNINKEIDIKDKLLDLLRAIKINSAFSDVSFTRYKIKKHDNIRLFHDLKLDYLLNYNMLSIGELNYNQTNKLYAYQA